MGLSDGAEVLLDVDVIVIAVVGVSLLLRVGAYVVVVAAAS